MIVTIYDMKTGEYIDVSMPAVRELLSPRPLAKPPKGAKVECAPAEERRYPCPGKDTCGGMCR